MNQNNSTQIPKTEGNNIKSIDESLTQECYIQDKCDCEVGEINAISNPDSPHAEPRPVYVCPKDYKKAVRLGMVTEL